MIVLGISLLVVGLAFIFFIMCLFVHSGRISEQEERMSGTCEESQAGFDLFK